MKREGIWKKVFFLFPLFFWKEEINEDLTEYGIEFSNSDEEQVLLSNLLNSFIILLNNSTSLPSYRKVSVDRYQYFK